MSLHRILPVCLLLVTAIGATGSARADHSSVNGQVARLHGQASVVEAEIRGGYRRSSHYAEMNQLADTLHHEVDELQSHLRMGASMHQLRRDAYQVNQALVQLDGLVEHVISDIRRGTCSIPVNPHVLHRRLHDMSEANAILIGLLTPNPTTAYRPTWGGSGFGSGFGYSGYGSGYGVNPQPGFSIGNGSGGFYIGGRNWGIQFGR